MAARALATDVNLGTFIRQHRPAWQHLEEMLARLQARGPTGTNRQFLHDLLALYRQTLGDLAYAQTEYRGTTLLFFLHQLVARAHYQIYRPHRLSLPALNHFFRVEIPRAARHHAGAITWSGITLLTGLVAGLAAGQIDERSASLLLPPEIIDSIDSGHLWTGQIFTVLPASITSTAILTNNLTVALLAFAGGLTFGVTTVAILFLNGFLLGVVVKLCSDHQLLGPLADFLAGHGLTELSAIVVAGGSGLALANSLVCPGRYTRADALAHQGPSALRLVLVCVPTLAATALVEALISPSAWPGYLKAGLGLAMAALFWSYLALQPPADPPDRATPNQV